jgi:hypothetical protein
MRRPDGSGERWTADERGGTGQARAASDDLRRRLDRLAACHPSSPDYRAMAYGEPQPGEPDSGEPGTGEPESGEPDYRETEYDAAGAGAERANDEQDRQAARPGGRDGEPASRGEKPAGALGPGRPAGWPAGDAGHRPDGGAAGGLAGRREPYRPWFTAGESPEPWFTGESGG